MTCVFPFIPVFPAHDPHVALVANAVLRKLSGCGPSDSDAFSRRMVDPGTKRKNIFLFRRLVFGRIRTITDKCEKTLAGQGKTLCETSKFILAKRTRTHTMLLASPPGKRWLPPWRNARGESFCTRKKRAGRKVFFFWCTAVPKRTQPNSEEIDYENA